MQSSEAKKEVPVTSSDPQQKETTRSRLPDGEFRRGRGGRGRARGGPVGERKFEGDKRPFEERRGGRGARARVNQVREQAGEFQNSDGFYSKPAARFERGERGTRGFRGTRGVRGGPRGGARGGRSWEMARQLEEHEVASDEEVVELNEQQMDIIKAKQQYVRKNIKVLTNQQVVRICLDFDFDEDKINEHLAVYTTEDKYKGLPAYEWNTTKTKEEKRREKIRKQQREEEKRRRLEEKRNREERMEKRRLMQEARKQELEAQKELAKLKKKQQLEEEHEDIPVIEEQPLQLDGISSEAGEFAEVVDPVEDVQEQADESPIVEEEVVVAAPQVEPIDRSPPKKQFRVKNSDKQEVQEEAQTRPKYQKREKPERPERAERAERGARGKRGGRAAPQQVWRQRDKKEDGEDAQGPAQTASVADHVPVVEEAVREEVKAEQIVDKIIETPVKAAPAMDTKPAQHTPQVPQMPDMQQFAQMQAMQMNMMGNGMQMPGGPAPTNNNGEPMTPEQQTMYNQQIIMMQAQAIAAYQQQLHIYHQYLQNQVNGSGQPGQQMQQPPMPMMNPMGFQMFPPQMQNMNGGSQKNS